MHVFVSCLQYFWLFVGSLAYLVVAGYQPTDINNQMCSHHRQAQYGMATPFPTCSSGPISQSKCCVTTTVEILWPVKPFFVIAFENSQKAWIKAAQNMQPCCAGIFWGDVAAPMVDSHLVLGEFRHHTGDHTTYAVCIVFY